MFADEKKDWDVGERNPLKEYVLLRSQVLDKKMGGLRICPIKLTGGSFSVWTFFSFFIDV